MSREGGGRYLQRIRRFTDEFMGAIRVGSVRLKPSLNDTKIPGPTSFAAVGKRAQMRPPCRPQSSRNRKYIIS